MLNSVPRNVDVYGSVGIAPTFMTSTLDGRKWSAHTLAALIPGKEPVVPIGYEHGWAPEPMWTL
jgi:hypothetical protein